MINKTKKNLLLESVAICLSSRCTLQSKSGFLSRTDRPFISVSIEPCTKVANGFIGFYLQYPW